MTSFTLSKTSATLFSNQSVPAGGTEIATIDLRTSHGGTLSIQIKNGGTGPTLPARIHVAVSHSEGITPSASDTFGTDWFIMTTLSGTKTANDIRNFPPVIIPSGVQHLEVVATGHTGQAVIVTAKVTVVETVETDQ